MLAWSRARPLSFHLSETLGGNEIVWRLDDRLHASCCGIAVAAARSSTLRLEAAAHAGLAHGGARAAIGGGFGSGAHLVERRLAGCVVRAAHPTRARFARRPSRCRGGC